MTKVTDYKGVIIKDTISAEARKQELSENERTLLWDTPILIETTNHEWTLGIRLKSHRDMMVVMTNQSHFPQYQVNGVFMI